MRTNSKDDRELWLDALASTRCLFSLRPLNDNLRLSPDKITISAERLKRRLADDGINESLVQECEQIMLSEFSEIQGKLKVLCEERSNLLDTLRQLEVYFTTYELYCPYFLFKVCKSHLLCVLFLSVT